MYAPAAPAPAPDEAPARSCCAELRALRLRRQKKNPSANAATARTAMTTPTIVPVFEDEVEFPSLFAALLALLPVATEVEERALEVSAAEEPAARGAV